jgi:acetyl esterase/lipase
MRWLRLATIVALLVAVASAARGAVAQEESTTSTINSTLPATTDTVDVQQDIPYYEGGPVLDAYLPKDGQTKRPALVMVHGGGWNSGDKAEFAPYALQAANEQKWAVFDVDYLLSPTDPSSWPDELHDIQAAIRYIASNAPQFGIDPQKIVALGESAGANLLALISSEGTANPVMGDPVGDNTTLAVPIRAVGLWSPPVDLPDLYANAGQPPASCGADQACNFIWSQGAIGQYLHCDPSSCPQSYADASPTTWVTSNTAPSFVANSSNELVPLGQVVQYVQKLQAAKVDVQFVELPGTLHAIQYGGQVWAQTISFLDTNLVAPPPTTTIAPTDTSTTSADPPSEAAVLVADSESSAGRVVLALIAAAVVVAVIVALIVRRRRTETPDPPDVIG